jgi:hypothetical protein
VRTRPRGIGQASQQSFGPGCRSRCGLLLLLALTVLLLVGLAVVLARWVFG